MASVRVTVYPEGSKTGVLLTPNEHLATGGEGSVYRKGDTVFKLFLDPTKALSRGIDRKLVALQTLAHPGIAAPQGLLLDAKGSPIGLSLPFVQGEALCRAYTNTWRDPNGFALPQTGHVVDAMREIVAYAHAHQALTVDANELNWLLRPGAAAGAAGAWQPVAIDVDSWQLPGFPAAVIMPSIRDHASAGFSPGTDWFAWAIVTFQLWTGIHPYKGVHPDFGRGALEERMKARASIFDAGVKLPGAVRSHTDIPGRLLGWYERMFRSTDRTAPPRAADGGATVATQVAPKLRAIASSTATLSIERLVGLPGKVVAAMNGFLVHRAGNRTASAALLLWDAQTRESLTATDAELQAVLSGRGAIVRLPATQLLLILDPAGQKIHARELVRAGHTATLIPATLDCQGVGLWQAHGRVFLQVEGVPLGLQELDILAPGSLGGAGGVGAAASGTSPRLHFGIKQRWPAQVLSSRFFRNVFVQDALGTPFIGVITPTGLVQAAAKELKGFRVINGFAADERNVWLSAVRTSDGEQVRLRLKHDVSQFSVEAIDVVSDLEIDAAMTNTGVAVLRLSADELLVTKGLLGRRVSCAGFPSTTMLFGSVGAIGGFDETEIVKVSLR